MDKLIAGFSNQLREGLDIANAYTFTTSKDIQISNVLVVGMGGSGIGGTVVQNYAFGLMKVPLLVSKSYYFPQFVSKNTLVIICSYSGNTEEALYNIEAALGVGCPIITITSGGRLQAIAAERGLDCILIPGGLPPRSCFGYATIQLLRVLHHFSLIDASYQEAVAKAADLLDSENEAIKASAAKIATEIAFKTPIIYSESHMEGVAIRWRQQFNENGKMLAWHNVIPEMNHNELVGWREKDASRAVLFLKNECDFSRSKMRMDFNKATISNFTPHVYDIYSKGDSYLERAIYLVNFGDWISWYLAQERQFDATEVRVIDELKASMSQ